MELARQIAASVLTLLTELDLDRRYPAVAARARSWDLPPSIGAPLSGRRLADAAWAIAQEVDPDHEGVHPRTLARLLLERGVGIAHPVDRRVYDALNHAHLQFDHLDGVFVWKAGSTRDPAVGLSGRTLAEACYAAAMLIDPSRSGVSYRFDVIPVLERWRVPIKNVDMGATVNAAMRTSPLFERRQGDRRGYYRWVPRG